jgi:hypothetical protein
LPHRKIQKNCISSKWPCDHCASRRGSHLEHLATTAVQPHAQFVSSFFALQRFNVLNPVSHPVLAKSTMKRSSRSTGRTVSRVFNIGHGHRDAFFRCISRFVFFAAEHPCRALTCMHVVHSSHSMSSNTCFQLQLRCFTKCSKQLGSYITAHSKHTRFPTSVQHYWSEPFRLSR